MRPVVTETIAELPPVTDEFLNAVRRASPTRENHARYLRELPVFHLIEGTLPRYLAPWPTDLSVASFNVERLTNVDATRALLDASGAHVALLTEVDVGMARSGNLHTLRELTAKTGEGFFYAVEFVELDLGDETEIASHVGKTNARSFHGNAIVSSLRLERPHLIPLEESGFWFPGQDGAQRRIGGRMALAARLVDAPFPLWVVSVHLESKTTPEDRRSQIQALLRGLDTFASGDACIIGGDLNTKELPAGEGAQSGAFAEAERYEPLFEDFRREGFTWLGANAPAVTQRTGPSGKPRPPFRKLDWILVRGVTPDHPQVIPALDFNGRPVSDHEMLAVSISLERMPDLG
jgi:endonuclease/exonuclease/phosphatase family metal-dependent hydrolase